MILRLEVEHRDSSDEIRPQMVTTSTASQSNTPLRCSAYGFQKLFQISRRGGVNLDGASIIG